MPTVSELEDKIRNIEGFDVRFMCEGRDVRGDKSGLPDYPYTRQAKNDMTVSEYKMKRFNPTFTSYEPEILDGDGKPVVAGQTKLSTVRSTYY